MIQKTHNHTTIECIEYLPTRDTQTYIYIHMYSTHKKAMLWGRFYVGTWSGGTFQCGNNNLTVYILIIGIYVQYIVVCGCLCSLIKELEPEFFFFSTRYIPMYLNRYTVLSWRECCQKLGHAPLYIHTHTHTHVNVTTVQMKTSNVSLPRTKSASLYLKCTN